MSAIEYFESFGVESAAGRLSLLRRVVDSANVDGLLFVAGVDGGSNDLSRQVISWLLFGSCHGSMLELFHKDLAKFFGTPGALPENFDAGVLDILPSPDVVEDVMLFMSKTSVRIYCPVPALALKSAGWPSCLVLSPPLELFLSEDVDALEEFKIHAFVSLCGDAKVVGVPLHQGRNSSDVMMTVEQWPIVQGYALESDSASRGFFSLKHSIQPAALPLENLIFSNEDAHSLHVMRTFVVPNLSRHVLDSSRFEHLQQPGVSDNFPLNLYFNFGEDYAFSHGYRPKIRPHMSRVSEDVFHLKISDPKWPIVCDRMVFARSANTLSSSAEDAFRRYCRLVHVVRGMAPVHSGVQMEDSVLEGSVVCRAARDGNIVFSEVIGVTESVPVLLSTFSSKLDILPTLHPDHKEDADVSTECSGLSVRMLMHDELSGTVVSDGQFVFLSATALVVQSTVYGPHFFNLQQDVLGFSTTVDNHWIVFRLSPTLDPLFGVFRSSWFALRNDHQFVRRRFPSTDSSLPGLPEELRSFTAFHPLRRSPGNDREVGDIQDGTIVVCGHFNSGKEELQSALLFRGIAPSAIHVCDDDDAPFQVARKFAASGRRISLIVSCFAAHGSIDSSLRTVGLLEQYIPGFVQGVFLHPGSRFPEFLRMANPQASILDLDAIVEAHQRRLFMHEGFKEVRSCYAAVEFAASIAHQCICFFRDAIPVCVKEEELVSTARSFENCLDAYISGVGDRSKVLKYCSLKLPESRSHIILQTRVSDFIRPPTSPMRKRKIRSPVDLTDEDREAIRAQHLFDPLPEGCFFNGNEYLGFDGFRSRFHPSMDAFIEDFIQEYNAA
eukprot:ANDGO_07694.mRNA.1 hypothetical protein (macronuclear)